MSLTYYNFKVSLMKTLIFNIWTNNETSDVKQHKIILSLRVVLTIYLLILLRRVSLFFVALKMLMFVLRITKQIEFLQLVRCTLSFTRNRLRRKWNITSLYSYRYWLESCFLSILIRIMSLIEKHMKRQKISYFYLLIFNSLKRFKNKLYRKCYSLKSTRIR